MRCIAIATRFNPLNSEQDVTTNWYTPKSRWAPTRFFSTSIINRVTEDIKEDITALCNTLASQDILRFENNGMYTHIKKLGNDCCAIICDVELTNTQLTFLTDYALTKKIPLATLAADLESYCHYHEALVVQTELDSLKEIAQQTLDKALQRGDKIDDLLAKSTKLEQQSVIFQRMTEKFDSSCWPSWGSIRARCVIS